MGCYEIAICDTDEIYCNRLVDSINNNQLFSGNSFTDIDYLKKHLNENKVDILLILSDIANEEILDLEIDCKMLLSEGTIPSQLSELPVIDKYQSSEDIIKEVIKNYAEINNEQIIYTKDVNTEILGIYSPIGRSGKTVASLMLAYLLSEYKKVLYINLEHVTNMDAYIDIDNKYTLSDFLYYINQRGSNISLKLESIKKTVDTLDFLPPANCFVDINDLLEGDWKEFIKVLRSKLDYDMVILNFDSTISHNIINAIKQCDSVYSLLVPEKSAVKKYLDFENSLKKLDEEEFFKNITCIVNQTTSTYQLDKNEIKSEITLPFDENLILDIGNFRISHNSEWTEVLLTLANKILNNKSKNTQNM